MKSIPADSLKFYLEHCPEFCGTARAMRFKVPDTPQGYTGMNSTKKSRVTTAMVFDYDAVKEKYGVNIQVDNISADEEDQPEAPTPPPTIFD